MTALVHGELIKLRSTRTALGFAAAAVLLVLATVLVTTLATDPDTIDEKRAAINFGGSLALPLLLFGAVGATGEYRHHTLAPALLIAPDRGRLTLARMVAYGLCALLVGVAMLVTAFGLGIPLLGGAGGPDLSGGDYLEAGAGGLAAAALCVMIGVGVGVLVRNQVAAVVGSLVYLFILEPLVQLVSEDAFKFTIGQSAAALGGSGGEDFLGWGAAAGVLAAWAALFVAIGVAVDGRRDVA